MMNFPERFEKLLHAIDVSGYKLAKIIGTSEAVISNIKSGKSKPSMDFLEKLLSKYKVINANWLICGYGSMLLENLPEFNRNEEMPKEAKSKNTTSNDGVLLIAKQEIIELQKEVIKLNEVTISKNNTTISKLEEELLIYKKSDTTKKSKSLKINAL